MGRLDNIIARNRRRAGLQERVIVSMVLGAVVLIILVLAVFTDLGMPPGAASERPAERGIAPVAAPQRGQRVDGVLLVRPGRPAQR